MLLIPGYLAGDASLGVMTRWLRGLGYRTRKAGIRSNVDCSTAVCDALEERLERMADVSGDRVAIIGQSRGGVIARSLAKRRPDLVSGIVTLGSPNGRCSTSTRSCSARSAWSARSGALQGPAPVHASTACAATAALTSATRWSNRTFPDDVGYKALYSKRDGIVSWRACLDPAADELIEVDSSHCGMAVNSRVYGIVGRSLAEYFDVADEPVWTPWVQAA